MAMPRTLTLVRHGQSQANIANRMARKGYIKEVPEVYKTTPDREIRLTDLGREQAVATGKSLGEQYPCGFDEIYVSDHARAKETVALLCKAAGWKNVKIKVDPQLGERNWGTFHELSKEGRSAHDKLRKRDPINTQMPNGENMLSTRGRARLMLERCNRQFEGKEVLIVSHGEYIEAMWSEIEHMRTEKVIEFFESSEGDIKNCQVVEFKSGDIGKFETVTTSNPYLHIVGTPRWIGNRTTMTIEEMLEEVELYPRLPEVVADTEEETA